MSRMEQCRQYEKKRLTRERGKWTVLTIDPYVICALMLENQ